MKRVNRILKLDSYQENLGRNEEAEKERRFCHHDMGHFLDVARIAALLNLEEGYGLSGELIYAAALLHDIGRWQQYKDGTPHEKASAKLAQEMLPDCGFTEKETKEIVAAIANHRNSEIKEDKNLNGLLYRADKKSRACFACRAEKDCNWKKEKKNKTLVI